jgi:endonuclease/exonuclease/phosphatase family metal-dependent hydrolase
MMMKRFLIVLVIIIIAYFINLQIKDDSIVMVSGERIEETDTPSLIVMTYNIRHGVGLDGHLDLDRIVEVIRASKADIIGLNEVDQGRLRTGFQNQIGYLARKLGMNYAFGPTCRTGLGSYGNAILSRYPIESINNYHLPGNSLEKRALLTVKTFNICVMVTHLSLNNKEREEQLKYITDHLIQLEQPYLLMGDFNVEPGRVFDQIPSLKGVKTYPAQNPEKSIDLFFSNLNWELIAEYTIDSQASDHLPVLIELKPLNIFLN